MSLAAAAAGMFYASRTLTFMTSGRDLLPKNAPYVRRDAEYGRDFSHTKQIIVAVAAPSPGRAKAYARRFGRAVRARRDLFQHVTYRVAPRAFRGRALLYLSRSELTRLRDRVFDYRGFMTAFAARPSLDRLIDGIRTQVVSGFVSHYFDLGLDGGDEDDVDLDFVREVVRKIAAALDGHGRYRSPWTSFISPRGEDSEGYFLSDDRRLLFVMVDPVDIRGSFTGDRAAIEGLRGIVARLRSEFPDVRAGVTGAPALDNDEMVAAFRDSRRAAVLAFVLTLGLLLAGFRRVGMPVLMLVTLAVILGWSLGITALVIGHLSIFSVMFISIVIGIGIDYGIYFLFRNDEELLLGGRRREALERAAARSGPGMLIGSLTAAGTFYVLMATDFRGVQELGFIAGTSILLAWLAMMTLLPAFLMLVGRVPAAASSRVAPGGAGERLRVPFIEAVARHPRVVIGFAVAATCLSLLALRRVPFDYNLLHLQAAGTESVVWEERILASAGRSSFAALSTAGSLPELARKVAAFERLGSVSAVDSLLMLIPKHQEEKRRIIAQFAPLVAPVRVHGAGRVDVRRLRASLQTLARRLDLAVDEAPPGRDRDSVAGVRDEVRALGARLRREGAAAAPRLARLQRQIRRDFIRALRRLKRNLHPLPLGPAEVPKELRRKFIGHSGRYLMEIHPEVDIWSRAGAERFVTELRSVDPEVAGIPVISFEAIRHMERAYKQGALHAFALVALLALVTIRRPREAALALVPLGLATIWTAGLMYVFGLSFNLGNVFGLPLLIGAGAEFGLNIVLRFLEEAEQGGPLVARSTVMAVLLNGLTTIGGFGSLMIAAHRGIFGLGLLLTLGMVATLGASLVVLPVLLALARRSAERKRVVRGTAVAAEPRPAPPGAAAPSSRPARGGAG